MLGSLCFLAGAALCAAAGFKLRGQMTEEQISKVDSVIDPIFGLPKRIWEGFFGPPTKANENPDL